MVQKDLLTLGSKYLAFLRFETTCSFISVFRFLIIEAFWLLFVRKSAKLLLRLCIVEWVVCVFDDQQAVLSVLDRCLAKSWGLIICGDFFWFNQRHLTFVIFVDGLSDDLVSSDIEKRVAHRTFLDIELLRLERLECIYWRQSERCCYLTRLLLDLHAYCSKKHLSIVFLCVSIS